MVAGAATIVVPVIITLSTFICGILIEQTLNANRKKGYFIGGLFINLGLLIFFKYINFFIATAFDGFNYINRLIWGGQAVNHPSMLLQLIIPLGISYITFQAIGYLIEIKRGNHEAERNLGLFATYIMFFPKLLSGPIERSHDFLPQLYQKHEFNYNQVVAGLKRILWGLFLKLVIASRLALYTDTVFNNYKHHTGNTLVMAAVFFLIQLFADLAGYTDIAIGSAQILGYNLMENFNSPFIAKSVSEFWRRWHISLSSWVNEYIYNPIVLNYRTWNKGAVVIGAIVTFLILGFWHGANWTFIIFGLLHGTAVSIEFLTRKLRKRIRNKIPIWLNTLVSICFTSGYFCFSLIFFRADTIKDAFYIIEKIATSRGNLFWPTPSIMIFSFFGILVLTVEGIVYEVSRGHISLFNNKNWIIRKFSYAFIIIIILLIGVFDGGQFIYFKF